MRTWNVNLASALLLLTAGHALAQPAEAGGEAALKVPDLSTVSFLGMNGHNLLHDRHCLLCLRPALRHGDLHAAQEPAGS
jgi:hypothetical protein